MERAHLQSAEAMRPRLGDLAPHTLRAALLAVPAVERDAWVDVVLCLDAVPDDGPALPPGCVPYLPCPVDALLRVAEEVGPGDVVIDVGAGVGRAAALLHLLTGAAVLGVEVQPQLVNLAQALAARLPALTFVEADIGARPDLLARGTVFFLYCPFSGARLEQLLDALEPLARARPLCVACVDLPLPERSWLSLRSQPDAPVCIYRGALR